MEVALDIASWFLIVVGGVFLVAGALGLLRMPDIYTRMHAASLIDTLGAGLMVFGLILQVGFSLVALKLLFVLALLFFFSPVASHALAQAALSENIDPVLHDDRRDAREAELAAADGDALEDGSVRR